MPLKWEACPGGNFSIISEIRMPKSNLNHIITVSGMLVVTREITGSLSLVMQTHKCNVDMTKCENDAVKNIPDVCKRFKDKNPIFAIPMSYIKPKFECPVKPGNYTIDTMKVDLSILAMMPIDGYIYLSSLKFVSSSKGGKLKTIEMCWNVEMKIVKVRQRL